MKLLIKVFALLILVTGLVGTELELNESVVINLKGGSRINGQILAEDADYLKVKIQGIVEAKNIPKVYIESIEASEGRKFIISEKGDLIVSKTDPGLSEDLQNDPSLQRGRSSGRRFHQVSLVSGYANAPFQLQQFVTGALRNQAQYETNMFAFLPVGMIYGASIGHHFYFPKHSGLKDIHIFNGGLLSGYAWFFNIGKTKSQFSLLGMAKLYYSNHLQQNLAFSNINAAIGIDARNEFIFNHLVLGLLFGTEAYISESALNLHISLDFGYRF